MCMFLPFVVALLTTASVVSGTTVWRYDLESLSLQSERILVGRCTASTTEVAEGGLFTRVVVAVDEVVKGVESEEVILRLPGGQANGRRLHVAGMPTFVPGEEVVLFLTEEDPSYGAWPLGLAQGKFRVERGGLSKQAQVFQDLSGISFPSGGAAKKVSSHGPLADRSLDGFLRQVRLILGETGTHDAP